MPEISEIFEGAELPFYVRSLERRTHWRDDPHEILDKVFPVDDDGTISLYRIESYTDLMRVAVAINANRVRSNPRGASYREPLHLIAIYDSDIASIELRQSSGQTGCLYANKLHYGAVIDRDSQREGLVNSLLSDGRRPGRMTKGRMKGALEAAQQARCYAIVEDSDGCECE